MPDEWTLWIVVPIFKGRGHIKNCSSYGVVKLFVNGMKVMKMVLEETHHKIVTANEMQFVFISERKQLILCSS